MDMFGILGVGVVMTMVAGLFVLCAVVLILVVLVQKGKGGGLGAAFGGGGAGGGLLGSKTGDFLTWATIILAASFLLLAVVMAKWYRPSIAEVEAAQGQQQQQQQQPVPGGPTGEMPEVTQVETTEDANVPEDSNQ